MRSRRCWWVLLPLLLAGARLPRAAAEEKAVPSVAVLPFEQLSQEQKDAYLKAGLAETLTLALARVKSLQVV